MKETLYNPNFKVVKFYHFKPLEFEGFKKHKDNLSQFTNKNR